MAPGARLVSREIRGVPFTSAITREIASFSRTFPEMPVSCIGGFVLQQGDMSVVALLSFNEAPPEARLTLYIVYLSAGTMSPSFMETGIPETAENIV